MASEDLDYTTLTEPIHRSELRAFRRTIRNSQAHAYSNEIALAVSTVVFLSIVGIVLAALCAALLSVFIGRVMSGSFTPPNLFLPAIVLGTLAAYGVYLGRSIRSGSQGQLVRWFRMSAFAAHNELEFRPLSVPLGYPGMLFVIGKGTSVVDRLTTRHGRFVDMGDVRTGGTGRGTSLEWGYLALRLDRTLPNIILDARTNHAIPGASLPIDLDRRQKLSLEGDFDRYFTLYCPRDFETAALAILTPDVMQLLIEQSTAFDVEIVDDWMFLYSPQPLNFSDPATLRHLFTIVDTIGAKTVRQTRQVTPSLDGGDEDGVSSSGRRLAPGRVIVGLGTMAVAAIVYIVVLVTHVVTLSRR